ncbi:MAG TPA: G1 family glutamic endopeptidase [Trebonia sp.]|nr:G1 family glutamic endopeptidase [Trebonia sp.]
MERVLRRTVICLLAAVPALGLFIGVGVAASASVRPADKSISTEKYAAAKDAAVAFVKSLKVGYHSKNHPLAGHATGQVKGLTQVQSTNWSGYADTGSGFSSVSATWNEPTPSCSGRSTALAAFWVGIDGYTSASVEQDGTLIECYEGGTYQFSWWEIYPVNSVQVVGESVAAGDAITATVTRTGTSYKLSVTDSTHTANSFSTTQTYAAAADSSAEWIAEAPSGSTGVEPLAKFSTWNDANSKVTAGSTSGVISSFSDDEITMITSSGATEAQPSALNGAGNGFSVAWVRS